MKNAKTKALIKRKEQSFKGLTRSELKEHYTKNPAHYLDNGSNKYTPHKDVIKRAKEQFDSGHMPDKVGKKKFTYHGQSYS